MPRRREVPKRQIIPDPVYHDEQVTRFISGLMRRGKKSLAERIFYQAMEIVAEKTKDDTLGIFKKAMKNAQPMVEVKSRRVGGSNYQVPIEVRSQRRESLSIRWIIQYSKDRKSEKTMQEKLAMEFIDAANNRGTTIKKRDDVHRMAEANKAFAHYRW